MARGTFLPHFYLSGESGVFLLQEANVHVGSLEESLRCISFSRNNFLLRSNCS